MEVSTAAKLDLSYARVKLALLLPSVPVLERGKLVLLLHLSYERGKLGLLLHLSCEQWKLGLLLHLSCERGKLVLLLHLSYERGKLGLLLHPSCISAGSKKSRLPVPLGKTVADVAKRLGTKHVVYSGLENVSAVTGGKLQVLHFDGKGEVEQYFWDQGVPMTSVRIPFYYENFLTIMKPLKAPVSDHYTSWVCGARSPDSSVYLVFLSLTLSLPMFPMGDIPMDGISVADIGPAVARLFESPQGFLGKPVGLTAQRLTVKQYAEVLSKHMGKTVMESKITPDMYEKLGFPGAKELADMFRYKWMKPYRDIELTRQLNPNVRSFDQFLSENKKAVKDILKVTSL
ncbi:nmrA-like family domain-containing protein 1 [Pleurodeles waltl]|uniref:nmrA-like family domain-containing protein 1 n=1 Tax=Pleurodeles waltl TaxID=8319 RepID=UPI0037094F83